MCKQIFIRTADTVTMGSPLFTLVPLERWRRHSSRLAPQQSRASQADSMAFHLMDSWGNWRKQRDVGGSAQIKKCIITPPSPCPPDQSYRKT